MNLTPAAPRALGNAVHETRAAGRCGHRRPSGSGTLELDSAC